MSITHDGTAQRCDCCKTKTLAVAFPERDDPALGIQKKSNGSFHVKEWTLTELVHMLDPKGTSFRPVQIGSTGIYV
tara:strand:+ start:834 stop:1061 length:228 start_codon:yes stop_codon:yes gene_type:complete